ncbi:MAG: hypothetical protein M5U26_05825 [Planctomycetota bacterium]|nr:hypothetical protein [Planctomycetota bacterium]
MDEPEPAAVASSLERPEQAAGLGRKFQLALYMSGACFAGTILIAFTCDVMMGVPPQRFVYFHFGSMLAILVTGLLRFGYVLFIELQSRLHEWLITLGALSTTTALTLALTSDWAPTDESDAFWRALILSMSFAAAFILGSAWGWRTCHRLKLENGQARVRLLGIGWLFVLGLGTGALWTFQTVIAIVYLLRGWSGMLTTRQFLVYYGSCFALSLLAIPGLSMEWKLRKAAKKS